MGEFFNATLALLTSFPGNLVYHLILAFSAAGAFQAATNLWRSSGFPQGRRMVIGLGLLLLARLILFVGAGLTSKGIIDAHNLIPLDRAITALSLIVIIWLWAFPEPLRASDASMGLLALLTVAAAVFSFVWWNGNNTGIYFNDTWLDMGWEIYALALLTLGIILLLTRRPNSWGVGLAMLLMLAVGHLYQLIFSLPQSDFAGSVRLAQMAAYPLLLVLPYRFQAPAVEATPIKPQPLIRERAQYSVNPKVFRAILSIGAQKSLPEICATLTRTVAEAMLADVCLALLPPNKDGYLIIQSGYDLIQEKQITSQILGKNEIPLLLSAMERRLSLRLPASSTSRDLSTLGNKLELGRAGHLLASFALGTDKTPLLGIILLSPYSNRSWSNDDQSFLGDITEVLAQILQREQQGETLKAQIVKSQQNLQAAEAMVEQTQAQNAELSAELSQAHSAPEVALATAAMAQQLTQDQVTRLRVENKRLEELIESLLAESNQPNYPPGTEQLEEELRLTLEEITRLKSRLSEADQKLLNLQRNSDEASKLSDHQIEVFTSLAQEIRQPMSSIVGYTELLLGESVGILGALQRKFLERVKASSERIEVLLDDLFQIVTLDENQLELKPETVDLGDIIDEAILAASPQMRERNIILRVNLPDTLPKLEADRDALGQIFIHLLKNAGNASPPEGEIVLRASTYITEEHRQYMLIQVADQGGGIPTQDLPRVFSRLYRADNALIEGLGDTGVGLSIAKTLVEAHQGRIWVDTETGKGSTFSVLIPLLNGNGGSSA